ncbi:MAG: phosphopantetheine adenylyltransferase [Candidatus Asgardarchaeia archaeon]
MLFNKVAIGGTFEKIHKGHVVLIRTAFELGENVIVGLTTDDFVKKFRKPHNVSPYEVRKERLENFLRWNGWLERAEIIPLEDPYGPTVNDGGIDAIVVSDETLKTAIKINKIRLKNSLKPLLIIDVPLVRAEDGLPISTTRIEKGIIDCDGNLSIKEKESVLAYVEKYSYV